MLDTVQSSNECHNTVHNCPGLHALGSVLEGCQVNSLQCVAGCLNSLRHLNRRCRGVKQAGQTSYQFENSRWRPYSLLVVVRPDHFA